jgi:hypothetical protein
VKILIYVEPAVFRGIPEWKAPHVLGWALPMLRGDQTGANQWALASSETLCALARAHEPSLICCPLPAWKILSACDFRRDHYVQSLFDRDAAARALAGQGPLHPLAIELLALNQRFQPDLVIATGQNSLLPLAFPQARCLWMEQAPFPRLKRRDRIYLDPCGHQLGSALELASERIRSLPLAAEQLDQVEMLWQSMLKPDPSADPIAQEVGQAIRERAAGDRVALLVLQPADAITWEGCLGATITPEAQLAQWAAALPPGWVGIPLYHPHARLTAELEASLAAEYPQLKPLPPPLSGNVAEYALPVADAVVAVSSSVAGQALICGKQVVLTGRTPMRAFAANSLEALATPGPTLQRQERLALLAFLSHRYTLLLSEISDPNGPLLTHLQTLATTPDPLSWLLDLSEWTPDRLARLL